MPAVSNSSGTRPVANVAKPVANTTPAVGGKLNNTRFSADAQLQSVLTGKTLGVGAKGDGVKALQQTLIDMGFAQPGKPDGSFGKLTSVGIRNFQVNASKMYPDVKVTGTLDGATLKALDALAPAAGQQGQSKNIPAPYYEGKLVRVVVLKDEHRTFLYDANGKVQKIMMNAVGKATSQTDEGLKKVTGKLGEAESIAIGKKLWGGAVFGPRIVDLSWIDGRRSGEELHGTSNPEQLGQDVSHGCVRHGSADIISLFDSLKMGDTVAIVSGLNDKRLRTP